MYTVWFFTVFHLDTEACWLLTKINNLVGFASSVCPEVCHGVDKRTTVAVFRLTGSAIGSAWMLKG